MEDIVRKFLELIHAWKKEAETDELQIVNPEDILSLLKFIDLEAKSTIDDVQTEFNKEILIKELDILNNVISDLFLLRAQKIFISALRNEVPKNMTRAEAELYRRLRRIIENYERLYKQGREFEFTLNLLELKKYKHIPKEMTMQRYIVLEDLKDFISLEGFIYRGLKAGDIISIDKETAKYLTKKIRKISTHS